MLFSSEILESFTNIFKQSHLNTYYKSPSTRPEALLSSIDVILNSIKKEDFYCYASKYLNPSYSPEEKKNILESLQQNYFDLMLISCLQYIQLESIKNDLTTTVETVETVEESSLNEGVRF